MSLKSTTQITVDFSTQNYVTINAKQYDRSSRVIVVTCKNNGQLMELKSSEHHAFISYRKPDNLGVFNLCQIVDGKILIDLTEQMLAAPGIAYADLIIYDTSNLEVEITEVNSLEDAKTKTEINKIYDNAILTTMTFVVNIQEAAFDNKEIESSYEFNALNELMTSAQADYTAVMDSCNESESNAANSASAAKASEEAAELSESSANASKIAAANSASAASESERNAADSEKAASDSQKAAKASEDSATESKQSAADSAASASASEQNAADSENAAKASEEAAKESQESAAESESNAANSASAASTSEENAQKYCEEVKSVVVGLETGFIPMGTITFAELATASAATGYVYNISDDFVTDDTFREGTGQPYTAGTNVYYTADGVWDCFSGAMPATATVSEVREYLGI